MRGQPGALICGGEASMGPKRRLFGAPDSRETRDFVRQELHKILAEQEQRWNFDFTQGRPLEGRFQWEALPNDPKDDVAVIDGTVARPLAGLPAEDRARSVAADGGASDNSQELSPSCADRQTIIPEFFAQKKRVASGPPEKQCDEGDSDESASTSSSDADCLPPKRARPLP